MAVFPFFARYGLPFSYDPTFIVREDANHEWEVRQMVCFDMRCTKCGLWAFKCTPTCSYSKLASKLTCDELILKQVIE